MLRDFAIHNSDALEILTLPYSFITNFQKKNLLQKVTFENFFYFKFTIIIKKKIIVK